MSKVRIDLSDPETRAVWEVAKRARDEVAAWPAWKRGEASMTDHKMSCATNKGGTAPECDCPVTDDLIDKLREQCESEGWPRLMLEAALNTARTAAALALEHAAVRAEQYALGKEDQGAEWGDAAEDIADDIRSRAAKLRGWA